jgi:hypothetical protein
VTLRTVRVVVRGAVFVVRPVSDLAERLASLGSFPWGELADDSRDETGQHAGLTVDRYECRNCGREAPPNVDRCPNCSSANLRPPFL